MNNALKLNGDRPLKAGCVGRLLGVVQTNMPDGCITTAFARFRPNGEVRNPSHQNWFYSSTYQPQMCYLHVAGRGATRAAGCYAQWEQRTDTQPGRWPEHGAVCAQPGFQLWTLRPLSIKPETAWFPDLVKARVIQSPATRTTVLSQRGLVRALLGVPWVITSNDNEPTFLLHSWQSSSGPKSHHLPAWLTGAPNGHSQKQLRTQMILKDHPVMCPWLKSSSKKQDNDASFPSLLSGLQGPLGKARSTPCGGATPTEVPCHCAEGSKCQHTTNCHWKKQPNPKPRTLPVYSCQLNNHCNPHHESPVIQKDLEVQYSSLLLLL